MYSCRLSELHYVPFCTAVVEGVCFIKNTHWFTQLALYGSIPEGPSGTLKHYVTALGASIMACAMDWPFLGCGAICYEKFMADVRYLIIRRIEKHDESKSHTRNRVAPAQYMRH